MKKLFLSMLLSPLSILVVIFFYETIANLSRINNSGNSFLSIWILLLLSSPILASLIFYIFFKFLTKIKSYIVSNFYYLGTSIIFGSMFFLIAKNRHYIFNSFLRFGVPIDDFFYSGCCNLGRSAEFMKYLILLGILLTLINTIFFILKKKNKTT